MISGANEENLIIATARANIILKLNNTNEYKSWIILDNYIDKLQEENQQLEQKLEQRDNIISASINKYIKEYEQKIDFEIDMGSQGEYKKIKCYEEFINRLNDLKNVLEKSDK